MRDVLEGVGYLGRGLAMWATSPRLMLLGAVPALIVGVVYAVLVVILLFNIDAVISALTHFADDWNDPLRLAARIAVGLALVAFAGLLAVFSFTAITLLVGDPFYERIWRHVETRLGDEPVDRDEALWGSIGRAVGNALRLLLATASIGLALFAAGFIPLVGQTVVPVLGFAVAGWFLAVELAGFAFDARGLRLRQRRRMLGARRARTLGFGVATYALFLIPLGAVVVMPAAVAGATLLSRAALSEPTR